MPSVSGAICLTTRSFSPKRTHLDIQVVVREGELLRERDEGLAVLEQDAQDVGEFDDHLPRELRPGADERGDGVQGVEEKVRVDLPLERVEPRLQQQARLLLQLALDADLVPDLQGYAYDCRSAEADGDLCDPVI